MAATRHRWPAIAGGERIVWSFDSAQLGPDNRYLFLFVNPELPGLGPGEEEERRQADAIRGFGYGLRDLGMVASAYPSEALSAFSQVVDGKTWPPEAAELHEQMQNQEPFLLVIDVDFKEFDPRTHPWAVLWLPRADAAADGELKAIFKRIAFAVERDVDVFELVSRLEQAERKSDAPRWQRLRVTLTGGGVGVALQAAALLEKITVDMIRQLA
jgi:hypothetical protein